MEVLNPRSALLSNFEVLTLLRDLESDYIARTKTAQRIKKEEENAGHTISSSLTGGGDPTVVEISENLRTVEVEAIQYLSADFQPTSSQSPEGITQLVKDLAPFELTKAEKLQVVNLAPTEAVELYVVVEELEDRLGDEMEDILDCVRKSLKSAVSSINGTHDVPQDVVYVEGPEDNWDYGDVYGEADANANDIEFDDAGEGAGVEGDLDIDDD